MKEIVKNLNELLSDLAVFYRKLQNYHWNIIGKDFFVLHAKLEDYYDQVNAQIDEIGEHILMMGHQPLGSMQDYLENTTIKEAENKKIGDQEVFINLIEDYTILLQKSLDIKKKAEEKNHYTTSTLMDDYLTEYTKILWMLKQSMEK